MPMFSLFAFAGMVSALLVHALAWYIRFRHLRVAVILGAVAGSGLLVASALFLSTFFLYPDSGADGAYVIRYLFTLIWGFVILFAVLIGTLQARSLPAPWWQGVLSACFEAGLGFLAVVAANYTLQLFAVPVERLFQEPYGLSLNRFIRFFAVTLLALAVIRPIVRLYIRPGSSPEPGLPEH
jgi:hypothetical protein